jgi:hypothetical protein
MGQVRPVGHLYQHCGILVGWLLLLSLGVAHFKCLGERSRM